MTPLLPADIELLRALVPMEDVAAFLAAPDAPAALKPVCVQLQSVMERLLPFAPSPVLTTMLDQPADERRAGQYLAGTILGVEVAGLMAVSAQLAAHGRQSNEEVQTLTNGVLTMVVATITRYGGGIITWSGVGLTAFFDAATLGVKHAAYACAAARMMQAQMQAEGEITTSSGPGTLALRLAVQSGNVFMVEVGDHQHAELLITGRVVNRAVVAHDSSRPGQIIVADETRELLPEAAVELKQPGVWLLRSLPDESPPVTSATTAASMETTSLASLERLLRRIRVLQPYAPAGVATRHEESHRVGEFRPVTVLFANFYNCSRLLSLLELPALMEHDSAIIGRVLNTYYSHTRNVLDRYAGRISTIEMAQAGDRLMAFFGAPVAHEDDPMRAVQAGLALQADINNTHRDIISNVQDWTTRHPEQRSLLRIMQAPLRQRIGIASGTVFAGIVGAPTRHQYTIIGEPVYAAARIMIAAPDGAVLLSATTQHVVRQGIPTQPLPAISFQGSTDQIQLFQALPDAASAPASNPEAREAYAAPLIGRTAELAQLCALIAHVSSQAQPRGHVVTIVGEAGVGKTRLIAEALRASAQPASMLLIQDQCQSFEQTVAYALVRRLVRSSLALPTRASPAAQAAALVAAVERLAPRWSRFVPLLSGLLHLPIPETQLTQSLAPEQRRERLHDLVAAIWLAGARERGMIVVIDDYHWIDASSRVMIERLGAELGDSRTLLVLAQRPAPELEHFSSALGEHQRLNIGALDAWASELLLATLLESPVPPDLAPLLERAQGSPLLLEETLRYLIETGRLIRDEAGSWICTSAIDGATIPAHIEHLIIARLDRLDEDTRQTLQRAAVIGQRFEIAALAQMLPQPAILPQHLQRLAEAALIVAEHDDQPPSYQFANALIRDVVYGSMLFAQRRALHATVATTLAQVYAADLDHHVVALAHHWYQAEDYDRAFAYFLQAAQQAQARYAHPEALALYQQAAAISLLRDHDAATDLSTTGTLYHNMGDILALTGNYIGARNNYERLLRLMEEHASDTAILQGTIQRKIGSTHEHQGNLDQALAWFTRAEGTIPADDSADTVCAHAAVISDIGWIHFRTGELDQAQRYLEQARDRIQHLPAYDEQARIHNRLGGVAWSRGDLALAQRYVEQSLAACIRSHDLVGQAHALNNLGLISETQGWAEAAIDYGLQAMELYERVGNVRMLAIAAYNIGGLFYDREAYTQAHSYFTQALEHALTVRDTLHQTRALRHLGATLAALEQVEAAERTLQQSQFIAAQLHLPIEQIEGHIAVAELALKRGAIELAHEEYEQASVLPVEKQTEEYGRLQRLAARIAIAQGEYESAIATLTANAALFAQLQNAPEAEKTRKLLTPLLEQAQF